MASGYVREDPVGAVGEFSMRGGILDVWPPGRDAPGRIEFFGDTVDSIREFDPETQLSTTQLTQIEVPPMRELIVRGLDFREWASQARLRWREQRFARALRDRTIYADEGESFPGWEWLISLGHDDKATAFDYLKDAVLVIDEPVAVENYLSGAFQTLEQRYAETDAADDLGLRPHELYLSAEELRSQIEAKQRFELRALGRVYERLWERIFRRAVDARELARDFDCRAATVALLALCNGAIHWYERKMPREIDGITSSHWNPDDNEVPVYAFRLNTVCMENLTPAWNEAHGQANRWNPSSDTILLDGFSKSYAMTGWRVGYLVSPPALRAVMGPLLAFYTTHGVFPSVQSAARAAVTGPQDAVERMRRAYQERRDVLLAGLEGQSAIRVPTPRGAFYAFANVGAALAGRDIWALVEEWLALGVAVLPGTAFGPEHREWVRLSLATRREDVAEAATRLKHHYLTVGAS